MNQVSLNDLNIMYHSQIVYDDFILPIKIDIKDIKEDDYLLAFSLMNKYKIKEIKPQEKDESDLDNIKIVKFSDNELTLSYQVLEYQSEIDFLDQNKRINYCIKFLNTTDKLFKNNTQTLLEYLEVETMLEWLKITGMSDTFYNELYITVSYWIDIIVKELHMQTESALLLDDKDGKSINHNISKLQLCYEKRDLHYFSENENIRCYEKLSYREQHLMDSYNTKMYYIDIANNKEAREQIEKSKEKANSNRKSSNRGKY